MDYDTDFEQAEDMAVWNSVLWCVRLTLILFWIWIWEAGCDTHYQAEEGTFSHVLVLGLKHLHI